MPSYVYFDDREWDRRIDVTPEDIAGCDDVSKLKAWNESFEEMADSVRAQIEARQVAGTAEDEWLRRASQALAFAGMGLGKLRRRMKALGCDPNPLGTHLNNANQKLALCRAEAAHGRAFIEAAKASLSETDFAALQSAALALLSAQAAQAA